MLFHIKCLNYLIIENSNLMKKIYTTTIYLLTFLNMQAQYVLTAAHNLTPGDVNKAYIATDTLAQEGDAGANITWDFSTLTFTPPSANTNWVTPAGTPYDYVCPNATVSYSIADTWYYSKYDESGYFEEGSGNNNVEECFTNNKKYFSYPFTYNSIEKDTFFGERNGATQGSIKGNIVTKADGYGKMKLPYSRDIIDNVLRIKIVEKKVVEIRGQIMYYYTETYQWFSRIQKYPLFSIARNVTIINNKVSGEIYTTKFKTVEMNIMEPVITDIKKSVPALIMLTLFPNPAVNEVFVKFNSATKTASNIDLVDISGKMVESFKTAELNLMNDTYKINIGNYPKGAYFIRVAADEKIAMQKLIIQ